jgi:hypothetical protein
LEERKREKVVGREREAGEREREREKRERERERGDIDEKIAQFRSKKKIMNKIGKRKSVIWK